MKARKSRANLGRYAGDSITWDVRFDGGHIVARCKGDPSREHSQPVAEWLAEKVGFTGKTETLKGGALNERD